MQEYTTDKIRNVALVGHQGSGKTSLVEALLFNTGVINRLGRIEDGTTVSDWDEDEHGKGNSLSTSIIPVEFEGHKINILDTPGFTDFQGEVKNAILAVDAVIVVVDAVSGVQVGTELVWEYAKEFNQPVIVVINKLDRENSNYENVLGGLKESFADYKFIPVMLPVGRESEFKGVVNLLTEKAYYAAGKDRSDLPAEMADEVEAARMELIEAAAESDDALLEKYFEEETLSNEEIRDGMRKSARDQTLKSVPVFVTSATHNIGTIPLMEALVAYTSSPEGRRIQVLRGESEELEALDLPHTDDNPLVAYTFKTINDKYVGTLNYIRIFSGKISANDQCYNVTSEETERFNSLLTIRGKETEPIPVLHAGDIGVVAKLGDTKTGDTFAAKGAPITVPMPHFPDPLFMVAVNPRTQADSAKMGMMLSSLSAADPTLRWRQDSDTRETVLEGMGEVHVSLAVSRAERLGVGIDTKMPKVPYRETITREGEATYRHKKQTGGAGQFAEISLRLIPNPGEGYVYETKIVGGAIGSSFLSSINKGIQQILPTGVIAGFPVVDVTAVVFDGKEHPVDSKDIAFQTAGREGFKIAFREAGAVLMEPIMDVKIIVPEAMMGDVMGDLNTRRGRVQGMDTIGIKSVVNAQVPLAEMLRYGNELRSMSGGRGTYEMSFAHYAHVPAHLMDEVIAANQEDDDD
jgi:elongation factor G